MVIVRPRLVVDDVWCQEWCQEWCDMFGRARCMVFKGQTWVPPKMGWLQANLAPTIQNIYSP
jgi:hypothetical protein